MQTDATQKTDVTIDELAIGLRPGSPPPLQRLFTDAGSAPPTITWSPQPRDFANPLISRFAEQCAQLRQPDGRVLLGDFHISDFEALRDWMMLVDIEQGGRVFRYRHYGDGIADIRGVSLSGETTEVFGGHISRFFAATYRAVQAQKDWLLTTHEPPRNIFARQWERLIVPLFDPDAEVVRFAGMNVPDNELRPGLEIIPDPVLIVDEDRIVRYANRPAREMFGRQIYLGSNMDLFTFAGINISLPGTPEELAKSNAVQDMVQIVLNGTLIEHFLLTISGTQRWGGAYYVITLRLARPERSHLPPERKSP